MSRPTLQPLRQPGSAGRRERGVATLVVVAALFFIMSMVAAYTNRNLIFEQRTASNLYRSTLAFEAAEAGVEWTLSMLNSGRIDDSCQPSADVAAPSFRERYLAVDGGTGMITAAAPDGSGRGTVYATCVFDGTDWVCTCPSAGVAAPAAPAGAGIFPAFRIRLSRASTTQPGLVTVEANGCTRLDNACLNFPASSLQGEGRAMLQVLVALRSTLPSLPAAALTVRRGLDVGAGTALGAYNTDPLGSGISILAGGNVANVGDLQLGSIGGTPGSASVVANDPVIAGLADGNRFFEVGFGATPAVFSEQPAVRVLTECGTPCTAATIRSAAALHPGRILWVNGDVDFDSVGDVGSADAPVALFATGSVTFSSTVTYWGLLYSRAATWTSSGGSEVVGAAFAEGDFAGNATTRFRYDRSVLQRIQFRHGSFVRVPGGWSDFKEPL